MKKLLTITGLCLLTANCFAEVTNVHTAAAQGKLSVIINSASDNNGLIQIHLINNEHQFLGKQISYRSCKTAIKLLKASCHFENLPHGQYSVFAYHDQNRDGQFNTGALFSSSEKVAVSSVDLATNQDPNFQQSLFRFNSLHGQLFLNLQ